MARNRRSSGVLDFINNFNAAYDTTSRVARDFEMGRVNRAQAEDSQGFTQDQGAQLEKLAGQGYKIDFDQATGGYTATNDAGDTQRVAQQGVTDFMGHRTAQLDKAGVERARAGAMADVFAKYDPQQGMQMRRQLAQDEREDARYGREKKQWASQDSIEAIGKQAGEDWQASLMGEDGKQRAPTVNDFLANQERHAAALMQAGHSKEAMELQGKVMASRYSKVQLESAERKQALGPVIAAAAQGNYGPAVEYANQYLTGGASRMTGIVPGKDGRLVLQMEGADGRPMVPVEVDKDTFDMSLRASENPNAAYEFGERNYRRLIDERRENRADRAEGRAAAAEGRAATRHAQEQADRKAGQDAMVTLYKEGNPQASDAQLALARLGKMPVPGMGSARDEKYSYDPVKVQKAFGETSVDQFGKETVKRNPAKEKAFGEFMADHPEIRSMDEGLMKFNQAAVQGERKAAAQTAAARTKVVQNMTPEKLAATAKKYNMTVEQVRAELTKNGMTAK